MTIVVKYGGSAMRDPIAMQNVVANLLRLQTRGNRVIVVHGGGPEIDALLTRVGIEKQVVRGLRVTNDETMAYVEMALAGRSNKALVAAIQRAGGNAIGLSGRDGGLILAAQISEDLGRVGQVTHVKTELLDLLVANGFVPVICSIAADAQMEALNVNADSVASAVASAVRADQLILMTDTDGVFRDKDDADSLIQSLSVPEAKAMIDSGQADRGMIPKLEAAIAAVEFGVECVLMINGSSPEALAIAADGGTVGTRVTLT